MKHFLLLIFLISLSAKSQDYNTIDNLVATYPKFSKAEDLAARISNDFTSDNDKARAVFYWLAKNIRYNLKEYYSPTQRSYNFRYSSENEKQLKLQAIKDKIVTDVFNTKTGVCEDYAQSFKKICDLLQIEAAVIKGNVRNSTDEIGKPLKSSNHAWNAVKLNNKWLILDATWAAGSAYNGKWIRSFNDYFYNIPKNKIFKTHFPTESIWVLRFGRITLKYFYNQPIYTNSFLSLNTELISPKTGFIKPNKEGNIELKFKNLPEGLSIFYLIGNNRYSQRPIIKKENDTTTLVLKNTTSKQNLVLFINKKDALHFKIK
jgi:transglutaminase/protease-like cytokinesis protein 3